MIRAALFCTTLLSLLIVTAVGMSGESAPAKTSKRVHAFYYPWYGNPTNDGQYNNWNHHVAVRQGPPRQFPGGNDIGANFYPLMGCYSSRNEADLERHMRFLERAGVGVISVSWWGRGSFTDKALPALFKVAERHGVSINFHIEPHLAQRRRDAMSTREAIVHLIDTYGSSPAFYRNAEHGNRPLFYIYDSYLTRAASWAEIFSPAGAHTIRNTKHDALIIGLWVKEDEGPFMLEGHFDGFYTYFATEGFTHGSTPAKWPELARWAREHDKIFIPSVGPGYSDTRIRPWNDRNTRGRHDGAYYDKMFTAALILRPSLISVTSFNEWHEGTHIEPAVPRKAGSYTYENFLPRSPYYYLDRTAHWIKKFESNNLLNLPARQYETPVNVFMRGSLDNSRRRFKRDKKGHVAFIGGSITEMDGYRPMVCANLEARFPKTEFTFTDAGISSTCSTTGAFRLQKDVLDKGPVDLFFIEFAVNDDQDAGHPRRECMRGMEGIIRHARKHNPMMDIIITYFVNPGMLEIIRGGNIPLSIGSHDQIAKHYQIPTIHLAAEVARLVDRNELTWKEFGGTHPAPAGNALCAGMIDALLSAAWRKPLPYDIRLEAHPLPAQPLDALSYSNGRFIDLQQAQSEEGWNLHVPAWSQIRGSCRQRFKKTTLLCADSPGAELTLKFSGTAVGAYVLAGPDAGTVEVNVDNGAFIKVDLYHRFSKGLHYPRTVMLATDLEAGSHTLKLRIASTKNPASKGHAVRIVKFVAN